MIRNYGFAIAIVFKPRVKYGKSSLSRFLLLQLAFYTAQKKLSKKNHVAPPLLAS